MAVSQQPLPPALASLLDAGMAIAGKAPSARVGIARLDGLVRPGLLPPEVREGITAEIERMLETTAQPLPGREVEKLLKGAWGWPAARVLDDLDLVEPLAVRPHAQTHRGTLDGAPVAVKVARPRIAASARSDLVLLDALQRPLAALLPNADTGALLREVRERLLDELDFEREGELHRRVARGLRRLDGVEVARVEAELTTHDVHVSALLEGPTLVDGTPADTVATARTLTRVYLGAPRALRLVLANPRASDVVLRPGGGIALIGPGAARDVDPERLEAAVAVLAALRTRDGGAFAAAVAHLGLLPAGPAREAHARLDHILGPLLLCGSARLDDAALAAAGARGLASLQELTELARHATPHPGDLWALRMLGQLGALLAGLGVEEDWLELGQRALRDGWG